MSSFDTAPPIRFEELGRILSEDAFRLSDRWIEDAFEVQPSAGVNRRDIVRDELPFYLRSVGEQLLQSLDGELHPHREIAWAHGEQRWRVGWRLAEVIRDYQLLRQIILEHLDHRLDQPLKLPEVLLIDRLIDEAIERSVVSYTRSAEEELATINRSLEKRVRDRTRQLEQATVELVDAEQAERQRISEVLHDYHQQLLLGIRLRVGSLSPHSDAERALIAEIDDLIAQTIHSSRTLSVELSPGFLHGEPLETILSWLCERMRGLHHLNVTLDIDPDLPELSTQVRICLYHATRECLFNVTKHSDQQEARVTSSMDGPDLLLTISDHGTGGTIPDTKAETGIHTGLNAIRRRIELLHGSLRITSDEEEGFKVQLRVPVYEDDTTDTNSLNQLASESDEEDAPNRS